MTTIQLTNPWTGAPVIRDITGLSQSELDGYATLIDDEVIEAINGTVDANCQPEQWLSAYVDRVGPAAAGIVILGS